MVKDVGCAERRAEEMKQPWRDGVARRSSVLGLVIIWKLHCGRKLTLVSLCKVRINSTVVWWSWVD